MKVHGNSLKNFNPHHLYKIVDKEDDDIFKYGISDDPIEADGLSGRLRDQIRFLNLAVNEERFIGVIIQKNIDGRVKAKEIEDKYIDEYIIKWGRRPRGNLNGGTIKVK